MVQKIQGNWNAQTENSGEVVMKFTIQRRGAITDSTVERSSGVFTLDQNALRALAVTRQLPPLPDAFPNPALTVHLTFQYKK